MIVIWIFVCYLLGSIPFGLIISKTWNIDIRKHGSGNIGATNVLRILGPLPATLVFGLDFLKGALAIVIGQLVSGDPAVVILLGFAAVIGHMYSIFLGGKGGKGAATGLGMLAGLAPEIFIISAVFAGVVIYASRYVSLASIFTPWLVVTLMMIFGKPLPYILVTLFVAVFILVKHIPNIKRLLAGKESQIGGK